MAKHQCGCPRPREGAVLRAGDDNEEEEERCSRYDIVTSIRYIDRNTAQVLSPN